MSSESLNEAQDTPSRAAGRSAAAEAIRKRAPGRRRVPKPGAALRKKWSEDWDEFIQGWSEALQEDGRKQTTWDSAYSPADAGAMEEDVDIAIYEDRPATFWRDMGPFFAQRAVRKEMPYLVDDEGYVWFVGRDAQGAVLGFASLHTDRKEQGHLHGLYIIPEKRGTGLAGQLIERRLDYLRRRSVESVHTVASPKSAPLLKRFGFQEVRQKGSYQTLTIDLKKNTNVELPHEPADRSN